MPDLAKPDFVVGKWHIQPSLNLVSSDGVVTRLEPKVMAVLVCLAEHAGQAVTKEQLMRAAWADAYVTDQVLTHAIWQLRQTLGNGGPRSEIIETIPKRGYRLVCPAEEFDSATPPAAVSPDRGGRQQEDSLRGIFPLRWFVVAAITAVIAAALSAWRLWPRHAAVDSVAVLPFANQTNDSSLDYLADGITESVIENLSEIASLRVRSRNSVVTYQKQPVDIRRTAAALGVSALVLGALRRTADRTEITLELIEARTDRHLWGKRYSADASQIPAVEISIAEEVAGNLGQPLTPEVRQRMAQHKPTNALAYDAYLRGQYLLNGRINLNSQGALRYFQKAIDIDPNFAPAYAGIAGAYGLLAYYGGMKPAEALRLQEIAVNRALELDPDLTAARVSKGVSLQNYHRDLAGAEREIMLAIAQEPNSAGPHQAYAEVLQRMGKPDEAIAESRRAAELDPLWLGHLGTQAIIAYKFRRYDEAMQILRKYPDPPHFWCGLVYAAAGRKNEALLELNLVASNASPRVRCLAATGYAMAGRPERARAVLADTLRRQKEQGPITQYCSPYDIAAVYAALGERPLMFRWLRTAATELDPKILQGIRTDPPFDRYRADPAFVALVELVSRPR